MHDTFLHSAQSSTFGTNSRKSLTSCDAPVEASHIPGQDAHLKARHSCLFITSDQIYTRASLSSQPIQERLSGSMATAKCALHAVLIGFRVCMPFPPVKSSLTQGLLPIALKAVGYTKGAIISFGDCPTERFPAVKAVWPKRYFPKAPWLLIQRPNEVMME